MKIEKRGKYAGVKVHLDADEVEEALFVQAEGHPGLAIKFTTKLGKAIRKQMSEFPDLLSDRTDDQVMESLIRDKEKIEKQLNAMKKGKDWREVK